MQTADQLVLEKLADWLDQGESCWLCTIVQRTGSSPRPPGSLLACNARGELAGSLSGGCIEEDFVARISEGALPLARPAVLEYGVSAEENERLGLPCGGRLRVLVEPIGPGSTAHSDVAAILASIAGRRCIQRRLELATGASALHPVDSFQSLRFSDEALVQSFGPRMQMLLVGAGQLSRVLAELALAMDYRVLVCDPRDQVRAQWDLDGVVLLGGMPDDAVREHANDAMSIVITLTHDPRVDDMALMEALTTDAWYVGALGSRRTTEKRLKRLRQLDLSDAQIARLHAPVGLDIGSKTPVEIAVAIMAEITLLQRKGALGPNGS